MSYRRRTRATAPRWLYLISFVAITLLALALMLSKVFGWIDGMGSVANYIERIALAFAIVVPAFLSYYQARSMNLGWFVVWIISIILVIVFYILAWMPF